VARYAKDTPRITTAFQVIEMPMECKQRKGRVVKDGKGMGWMVGGWKMEKSKLDKTLKYYPLVRQ
jgi:hypothetical protein